MTEQERAYHREYRLRNKDKLKAQRATRRAEIREVQRAWVLKNKERFNATRRAYYHKNRDKLVAKVKEHYAKNGARIKRVQQLKRYGLTEEQYQTLALAQSNVCAVCKSEMTRPCVDHDHNTGKPRGILCSNCNTAIGLLGDSSKTAFNAANYLLSHGKA